MVTDEPIYDTEQACPHLRLGTDPSAWDPDPSQRNRCYRPARVREEYQAECCLVERHVECPLAPPISGVQRSAPARLMLGRQRMTRREAEEFVRTVLATVAVMGLLLVAFTGVVVSGSAHADGDATPSATAGAEREPGASDQEGAGGNAPAGPGGDAGSAQGVRPADGSPAADLGEGPETSEVDFPEVDWSSPHYEDPAAPADDTAAGASESEPEWGAGGTVYVVQRGDTLFSLARAHGVTVDALMAANGLDDPNSIEAGQELAIPEPAP